MNKNNKLFYGWWVVIVLAILNTTWCFTLLSVVLKPLMEQFHTGRGTVSIAQSISVAAGGVSGILAGKLLSRFRPKIFLLWGSIAIGLCSLLLSLAPNLWYFYVFTGFSGIAIGFGGVITEFTLLSKWFTRKWGTAVGLAQAGGFIGTMCITPLLGLISEDAGWRMAYLFSGLLMLCVSVPLIFFIVKDSPQPLGLSPDGVRTEDAAATIAKKPQNQTDASSNASNSTGLMSFLINPGLWLMWICFIFIGIGYSVVNTHEVSFITDMKISATLAASALGFTVGLSAVSNLAAGWLADKLSSRYVSILFIILAIMGMIVLIGADTMPKIWLFVALYGLGIGASGTLLPIVTRDAFGSASFSVLFGTTNLAYVIGFAIGAPLAGYMFDATGSYQTVFIIVAVIFAVAILAIYFAFGVTPKPFKKVSIRNNEIEAVSDNMQPLKMKQPD
jgi:sugar phosphate permease